MKDRREILTILGALGAGASVAISTEELSGLELDHHRGAPGLMMTGPETQQKFARLLANAAAAVQRGELTAIKMEVKSVAEFDKWMQHEVTFTFELTAPDAHY